MAKALLICLVGLLLATATWSKKSEEEGDTGLRFVFPFYPAELDILIGHLQTKVRRRQDSTGSRDKVGGQELGDDDISVEDKQIESRTEDLYSTEDDLNNARSRDLNNIDDSQNEARSGYLNSIEEDHYEARSSDLNSTRDDQKKARSRDLNSTGNDENEARSSDVNSREDDQHDARSNESLEEAENDAEERFDKQIGYLEEELFRVTQSLESCQEINAGNHEAGSYVINVNDKGDVSDPPVGRANKLETITDLRAEIKAAEAKLDMCRFKFWTGDSRGEVAK